MDDSDGEVVWRAFWVVMGLTGLLGWLFVVQEADFPVSGRSASRALRGLEQFAHPEQVLRCHHHAEGELDPP
jgi:hypothetical protein